MSPKPSPNFDGVTPVVLSASCTVARNNTGLPPSLNLTYPFRKPIWVEEIHFTISRERNDARFPSSQQLGAMVAMKLQLGRHYIAREPVPIWLFCTAQDRAQEVAVDSYLNTLEQFSQYRWRLPEPLYVEAGQTLLPTFSRGIPAKLPDDAFTNDFTVQVTYVGKTVAPKTPRPRSIQVPYVAPFVTDNSNSYQVSNEFDLFNIFDKPIRVQRMTGRVYTLLVTETCQEVQALTPTTAGLATELTVLVDDSWGGKMVNNPTGPSDVWDILRAAWTCDMVMPPKGQFNIKASNLDTADGQYLHVAMIATREEAI